jgi:hypothetical protein
VITAHLTALDNGEFFKAIFARRSDLQHVSDDDAPVPDAETYYWSERDARVAAKQFQMDGPPAPGRYWRDRRLASTSHGPFTTERGSHRARAVGAAGRGTRARVARLHGPL